MISSLTCSVKCSVTALQKRQSPAAKVFEEVAKELDQVVFGMVSKKDLLQAFNVEEGTMSVFKKVGKMSPP